MIRTAAALALAFVGIEAAAAQGLPATSVWENQSGSVLYIDDVRENGHFHGRYVNNAAGYACQGVEYRVVGDVFDPLIAFSVVWRAEAETCHTITSWTGEVDGGTIRTEWSLVREGEDGFARYSGESVFIQREEE
ncbi:avidin/streptavidin family protein [Hyphobacterium marinum]|uniref:Avidin/streptavidin family protein n=1 Tax=Hyphobacterium marinum TaxID=3116574 RepID=A0ABU7M1L9_9PROT|nr:avidin/streptavidin family protein [Hyphobacterium sp. Y6023]MEE2567717.1 avidin/streptavidin family protein [Hyphobacterium sp. Y6023]